MQIQLPVQLAELINAVQLIKVVIQQILILSLKYNAMILKPKLILAHLVAMLLMEFMEIHILIVITLLLMNCPQMHGITIKH